MLYPQFLFSLLSSVKEHPRLAQSSQLRQYKAQIHLSLSDTTLR